MHPPRLLRTCALVLTHMAILFAARTSLADDPAQGPRAPTAPPPPSKRPPPTINPLETDPEPEAKPVAARRPNRPTSAPHWESNNYDRYVHSGEAVSISVTATDDDRDQLTVSVKDLPAGARLKTESHSGRITATITWRPGPSDAGRHNIQLTVSDGQSTDITDAVVVVSDEWESFFMPGIRYGVYAPRNAGKYGLYHGPAVEIVFASWIHKNDKRGPSHGRTHLDFEVLTSTKKSLPAAFDVAFAFDLAMERNPKRNWLIPHFGLRTGATLNRGVEGNGTLWHTTPVAGAYLYADHNLFVTAQAGYVMPLSSTAFDALRGARGFLTVNYIAW